VEDKELTVTKSASKPRRTVIFTIITILSGLIFIAIISWFFLGNVSAPSSSSITQDDVAQVPAPTQLRFLATGDWIAHDAINNAAKTANGGYDYSAMTAPMKDYFGDSDIAMCNQATLAGGEQFGISGYPVFNAPLEWIGTMKNLGCNVINTGTNHTNDKGQKPIDAQLDEWDRQAVLAVAGANRTAKEQQAVRYFEKGGIKFAFVSYTTYSNAPNPNPYSLNRFVPELYEPQLKEANEMADIVVVSMRWGTEYSPDSNRVQESAAQTLTNLGADIILGHGPHVLQPVSRLTRPDGSQSIVWYSLGNFLNAQLATEALTGCVATFTIDIASKALAGSACLPIYQHYEWTAEESAREDLLARKNFRIMPLHEADEWLAKSQLNTTVEEQVARIRALVGKYTEIPLENN
jgi:poly-gamma-glutamate synthesis protein (capsule biosynthesis protein)